MRLPKMILMVLCLLLVFSSGCATLGKEECLNASWRSIGYEDGAHGRAVSQIGQHRKACAKHGVQPDMAAYRTGHKEGLQEYCTPHRGYQLGSRNAVYNTVCQGPLEADFMKGYREGKKIYKMNAQVRNQGREVKRLRKQLETSNLEVNNMEAELVRDGTSKTRRLELLEEIREAEANQKVLFSEITFKERRLARLSRQRDRLIAQSQYE